MQYKTNKIAIDFLLDACYIYFGSLLYKKYGKSDVKKNISEKAKGYSPFTQRC